MKTVLLSDNWKFRQESSINNIARDFLPVGQFPTCQWLDLLYHDLIPDPLVDCNELETNWVNDADWTYRTTFDKPQGLDTTDRIDLVFEGLDTVVDVFLNLTPMFSSKNMHLSHRIDVSKLLRDSDNELELRFKAANHFSEQERARIGWKKAVSDETRMGTHARLWLRKAQYAWGWDWGPCCTAAGPWMPVKLEVYQQRLEDIHIIQELTDDLKRVVITVEAALSEARKDESDHETSLHCNVTVIDPNGLEITSSFTFSSRVSSQSLSIDHPFLWWPFTHGSQPLYTVFVRLMNENGKELHKVSRKIGIRKLELLQNPLKSAPGTSFTFAINKVEIFCGGSNWIPDDFFLPKTTKERYSSWVSLLKLGNQNMVRVWGGGIFEKDDFYDLCDENGILVWQDFLFACGNYPAYDEFIDLVSQEVTQQLSRIRHHASLVILAGNNEDYMLAERFGWEYDSEDNDPEHWKSTNFPARQIYEIVLPALVAKLANYIPYWRSSPYGGKTTVWDTTVGDTHLWTVWHGPMHPYQMYKELGSRFVSEFGFEAPPDIRTVHKMISDPDERQSQSRTFDAHDKGPGYMRRFTMYMGENFRFRMDPIEDYVYCGQLLQAEAIGYAYYCWRRDFSQTKNRLCSGALVWQLNDNWPGTSWSLVDYYLRPKPVFYVIKRALQTICVGMYRVVTKRQPVTVRSYLDQKKVIQIWACSNKLESVDATLRLKAFNVSTGKSVNIPISTTSSVALQPNQTTEIAEIEIPDDTSTVVAAYLETVSGETSRFISWPEPLKYLKFCVDPDVKVDVVQDRVDLSATAPVKGLILAVDPIHGENAQWQDNCVDLVPGEIVSVAVKELNGRPVSTRWLCDWE